MRSSDSAQPKTTPGSVTKHLVSHDSCRSIYDNQPSEVPLSPVDYNEARVNPPSSPSKNNGPSTQSNATSSVNMGANGLAHHLQPVPKPRLVSPAIGQFVLETHLPQGGGGGGGVTSRQQSRQQSCDSAISDGIEVVELRLDLSDEDDRVVTNAPPTPPARNMMSAFQAELERSLSEGVRSGRSVSRSPDFDLDTENSHMYTRSAGFRSRNLSPRANRSSRSSGEVDEIQDMPVVDGAYRQRPALPPHVAPPSRLPVRSRTVEIPVTHLGPGNGAIPFPTHIRSPDDRPAYNPGYIMETGTGFSTSPKGPMPFPVPRSSIPVKTNSNIRTSTGAGRPIHALHVVSPTRPALPAMSHIPSYTQRVSASRSDTLITAPSPHARPMGFHTFGGRGRHKTPPTASARIPSPTTRGHRSFDNLLTGDGSGLPASAQSPRYVSAAAPRQHQTLPNTNRTFYVVSESSRQTASKNPYRYDFNEDDTAQNPVFL